MSVRDFTCFVHTARTDGTPTAEQVVTRYYRHRSQALLAPALVELAPDNTGGDSVSVLLFFTAAVLRTTTPEEREVLLAGVHNGSRASDVLIANALEAAGMYDERLAWLARVELNAPRLSEKRVLEPVAAGVPSTPQALNPLWGEFFATGSVQALELMSATLPSWHQSARRMRAERIDPSTVKMSGAGHASRWSLAANARLHAMVRSFCTVRANSSAVDAQEREELLAILADVAADGRERGADVSEARTLDWARARGARVLLPRVAPAATSTELGVVDTGFLTPLPADLQKAVVERLPTLEEVGKALQVLDARREVATEPDERRLLARDAGLIATAAGFQQLAVHLLEKAVAEDGSLEPRVDSMLTVLAARTMRWDVAVDRLEHLQRRLAPGAEGELEVARHRVECARKLGDRARLVAALSTHSDLLEQRVHRSDNPHERRELAHSWIERARLESPDSAYTTLMDYGLKELTKAARSVREYGIEAARAWLQNGVTLRREGRPGPSGQALEMAMGLFPQLGDEHALERVGAPIEARVHSLHNLHDMGAPEAALNELARALVADVGTLEASPLGPRFKTLIAFVREQVAPYSVVEP